MTAVLVLLYTTTRSVDTLVSVTTALVLNRANLVAEALNPSSNRRPSLNSPTRAISPTLEFAKRSMR
ncbi:hypothetical protein C481_04316 [Natrialba asiatica DSM 12278]|uniref:Uncharacterized protein n=1 Tax=Natrialba asiatica (strain ATCC 700177 / DSM 12278 / JCM 9576 / FERM P-10747 / NBRC 102637 / 172P1) TaxID=29540 RepID=M0B151_NATA1|nr:hypothetical protein C481_04316 [Natrialba asiatica DSM 12278]